MYKFIKLIGSPKKDKKWEIHLLNQQTGKIKRISFGANGYSDFTIHKNPEQKERYIARHQVNELWTDPTKSGTLSRFILWNKPNLNDSIDDYLKRFNITK